MEVEGWFYRSKVSVYIYIYMNMVTVSLVLWALDLEFWGKNFNFQHALFMCNNIFIWWRLPRYFVAILIGIRLKEGTVISLGYCKLLFCIQVQTSCDWGFDHQNPWQVAQLLNVHIISWSWFHIVNWDIFSFKWEMVKEVKLWVP
jgi:hypothetical protein